MKTKTKLKFKVAKIALAMLGLIVSDYSEAQFMDNYSSSIPWTTVGTGVSVTHGVCNFANAACGIDNRTYRSIAPSIPSLSDYSWTAEFEFKPTYASFQVRVILFSALAQEH